MLERYQEEEYQDMEEQSFEIITDTVKYPIIPKHYRYNPCQRFRADPEWSWFLSWRYSFG